MQARPTASVVGLVLAVAGCSSAQGGTGVSVSPAPAVDVSVAATMAMPTAGVSSATAASASAGAISQSAPASQISAETRPGTASSPTGGPAATGSGLGHALQLRQVILAVPLSGAGGASSASVRGSAGSGACNSVNTRAGGCLSSAVVAALRALGRCKPPTLAVDDQPNQPIAACGRDGKIAYVLAPVAMSGADVDSAQAFDDATQGWLVQLSFTSRGTTEFGSLTAAVSSLSEPLNQVAMVFDGVVQSAPIIEEAITVGAAQITGGDEGFTQAQVVSLAKELNSSALGGQ
jgi:preprotein translocase subunit SecD